MLRTPSFYIIFLTFSTYVGFFNAFSSLLNQILYPYGYSEDEAGICGAVLLAVGLLTSLITTPIVDRTHAYLLGIKILCPLVAASYLAMIWAPQTRTIAAPYILSAVLGASSFSLLPISLEYLVEITFPASPEVSSTICWVGGQVFGGAFIVIMTALKDERPVDLDRVRETGRTNGGGNRYVALRSYSGWWFTVDFYLSRVSFYFPLSSPPSPFTKAYTDLYRGRPPGHMFWALVFQAVVSLAVLPLPLVLGIRRLGLATREGRLIKDQHVDGILEGEEDGTAGRASAGQ
jgi:FLVCR family MFS transporter 7